MAKLQCYPFKSDAVPAYHAAVCELYDRLGRGLTPGEIRACLRWRFDFSHSEGSFTIRLLMSRGFLALSPADHLYRPLRPVFSVSGPGALQPQVLPPGTMPAACKEECL